AQRRPAGADPRPHPGGRGRGDRRSWGVGGSERLRGFRGGGLPGGGRASVGAGIRSIPVLLALAPAHLARQAAVAPLLVLARPRAVASGEPLLLAFELHEPEVARLVELALVERLHHRAARLVLVGAVAEPAGLRARGDLGERLVEPL